MVQIIDYILIGTLLYWIPRFSENQSFKRTWNLSWEKGEKRIKVNRKASINRVAHFHLYSISPRKYAATGTLLSFGKRFDAFVNGYVSNEHGRIIKSPFLLDANATCMIIKRACIGVSLRRWKTLCTRTCIDRKIAVLKPWRKDSWSSQDTKLVHSALRKVNVPIPGRLRGLRNSGKVCLLI